MTGRSKEDGESEETDGVKETVGEFIGPKSTFGRIPEETGERDHSSR